MIPAAIGIACGLLGVFIGLTIANNIRAAQDDAYAAGYDDAMADNGLAQTGHQPQAAEGPSDGEASH